MFSNNNKRHKDVIAYFNQKYIKSEIFPRKLGSKIAQAQRVREDSDYDDKYQISYPYMRTKHSYMLTLMELGRYTEAIKQGEELLRLCKNDNQGIRYLMLGLYTVLEKFQECEKLYNNYLDDYTFMVFPLSVMYYKKGDYKKAKKILKKIQENNEYILEYLKQRIKFTKAKIDNIEDKGTYSWESEAEAYFVVKDYKYFL